LDISNQVGTPAYINTTSICTYVCTIARVISTVFTYLRTFIHYYFHSVVIFPAKPVSASSFQILLHFQFQETTSED